MAKTKRKIPKNPWRPKNCECGRCIKVSSSIQKKCCEMEECFTKEQKHMQKIFEKAKKVSLENNPPKFEWCFKKIKDKNNRLLPMLQRSVAYKAYAPYKRSLEQTDGSSQQTTGYPTSVVGSNIPRCVVRRIREEFPDPKGEYAGFNTSNTLAMLFNNFVNDTNEDEKAFAVMKPGAVEALHNAEPIDCSFEALVRRLPRMAIITTVVSFECFVKDAITLAVDAVCYDICHVNEKDYHSSLKRALSKGELCAEAKKGLRSLTKCSDDELMKVWKWAYYDKPRPTGKIPQKTEMEEPKNLEKWKWSNIRAALEKELRDSKHMQTIFYSNFFQTLLEETKIKLVSISRPILCDFMQRLRFSLYSAFGKEPTKIEQTAEFHYLCDNANLSDQESKQVKCLLEHLIIKSKCFELFDETDAQRDPDRVNDAKPGKGVKVKPANINALCNMSCLFYGIRCLYCHGSGDKTIEVGVLSKKSFTCFELEAESGADRDKRAAQDYLTRLRDRARRDSIKLEADRFLYLNTANFYKYFAELLAKACVCLVHYCNKEEIVYEDEYFKKTSHGKLKMEKADIVKAIDAMKTGNQSESGRSESGKSESGQSESGKSESGRSKSGRSESGKSKSGRSEYGRSESGKSKSGRSKSGKLESGRSKSGRSEYGRSESGKSKSGRSESGKLESGRSKSGRSKSGKSKSGRSKSLQS